jgi:hypothetical protein
LDFPCDVAGNVKKLVDNVWRWTVAKDHIQSDLVIMIVLLESGQGRAAVKLGWSIPCCGIMYVDAALYHRGKPANPTSQDPPCLVRKCKTWV